MKGKFIVLEGIDGSGTTTQSAFLAESLRQQGYDVVLTHEPTEGRIGSLIRSMIKEGGDPVPDSALALLFAADRQDHIHNVILPALERGSIVISDRYIISSWVYQCLPEGVDRDWIFRINTGSTPTDLMLFVDVDAEEAMRRLERRAGQKDFYENLETQKRAAESYRTICVDDQVYVYDYLRREYAIHRVDGSGTESDVRTRIMSEVQKVLP